MLTNPSLTAFESKERARRRVKPRTRDVAVAHRPAVAFPEHEMTQQGMLDMAERHYRESPAYSRIRRMVTNTQIDGRRFSIPERDLGQQSGLAERTRLYMTHARPLVRQMALEALGHAGTEAPEIDLVITVSCTSFVMPSLDAYLINDIGLRPDVQRMPIAQMGCVAGVSAFSKAHDYCRAYPEAKVLIVAVETSSLCFFPEKKDLTSAVCASIFGDGAAACVVSGACADGGEGLRLRRNLSYTLPNSEHYIRYEVLDGGYHLTLDREVMHSIPKVAPVLESFLNREGSSAGELDFIHAHTGGKRILDALVDGLGCEGSMVQNSRDSLREYGNTASVSIFDVMHRAYQNERQGFRGRRNRGLIVAFGPGFTMEAVSASWE